MPEAAASPHCEHPCLGPSCLSLLTPPFPFPPLISLSSFPCFILNSPNSYFFPPNFYLLSKPHYTNNKGKKNHPHRHHPVASTASIPLLPSRLVHALLAVIFTELWSPSRLPRPADGRWGPGAPSSLHRGTWRVAQELCVSFSSSKLNPLKEGPLSIPATPMPSTGLAQSRHSQPRSGVDGMDIAV